MGVVNQIPVLLKRKMLALACRHHIAEIVLKHVFEIHGATSKSNNLDCFKDFQTRFNCKLPTITRFKTILRSPRMKRLAAPWRDSVIAFCRLQLINQHPRDDYRELLELVVMFLGEVPPGGVHFRKAGAISRARWMARGIYVLKVWMLSEEIGGIDSQTLKHYEILALFIAQCYIKYWYRLSDPVTAPRVDLEFYNDLRTFFKSQYALVAEKPFSNHFWYFSEANVALSFFDAEIDVEEKRKMVEALAKPQRQTTASGNSRKRVKLEAAYRPASKPKTLNDSASLSTFITEGSLDFFAILGIDTVFLKDDPTLWPNNNVYQDGKQKVRALQVINDVAERAVKLVTDFNGRLTRNASQEECLLQTVEYHRQEKPFKY